MASVTDHATAEVNCVIRYNSYKYSLHSDLYPSFRNIFFTCSWSYGSWLYSYLWNQYLSQLTYVSLNPVHGDASSMQHYVIKFVSDLRQVSGFLRVLRFSPPIQLNSFQINNLFLDVY